MSGRRVARVDAGLLSLTHRGPYVRYHFSPPFSRATLKLAKPWDRAQRFFLFHSLCSSLDSLRSCTHTLSLTTHTHTLHACARAHARAYAHGHAAQVHALTHAKSDARARAQTIVLFIPLVLTLPQRPRSFFLEAVSSFATSTTYHRSLSPTLSSPSIFLRLSLSTLLRPLSRTVAAGAVPAPPQRIQRSTSQPRSNRHEGSLSGKRQARGLSLSREFLTSALSHVLRTPGVPLLHYAYSSCRESVPLLGADCRDQSSRRGPLLHRHAPVFRAADSTETSHGAPRSTPAIPHSRSATRTNPRHSVDHPAPPCKATIPSPRRDRRRDDPSRGRVGLAGGIEVTLRPPLVTSTANRHEDVTSESFPFLFFPFLLRTRAFPWRSDGTG